MTPEAQTRWMRAATAAAWLCVLACAAAWLIWAWPQVRKSIAVRVISDYFAKHPLPATATVTAPTVAWPAPVASPAEDWSVLRRARGKGGVTVVAGPLQRFRLAGVFTTFEGEAGSGPTSRRAVLDDLQKHSDLLLREGESAEGLTLLKIFPDYVTVNIGGREEILKLGFVDAPAAVAAAPAPSLRTNEVALSTSRFGKRIAQDRWVLQREALMQYYEELRRDPERVLQLFDSFQPSYTPDKIIDGYKLHVEGEKEFLAATGLQEGDVVRKVNSINMTSQKRAEYLIGEFLQKRMSAVVFDIEREGKAQKLIYFVR